MSATFLLDCGLLARADSEASKARAHDFVRVTRLSDKAVERVHLGHIGTLHGYTAGVGYAIVTFQDSGVPRLVLPECIEPVVPRPE